MGLESAIPGIGMALGTIGAIGNISGNATSNRGLRKLQGQDPIYSANPIAEQRLSLAKTLLNARMPGAARAERNIYASGGNQRWLISRNATDSSQLLALGASELGQEENAFGNLAQDEAQNYQQRYQNLMNAEEGQINEGDKVFQDQTRRFGDRAQIQGAINANRQNTWKGISNLGFGIADMGMNGGFSGMFGGKGKTPQTW